jgi:hypothetical protein
MAFNFGEGHFLPLQVRQQPGRTAPFLDAGGDDQALASVIQRADIARPTVREAGEFAPACRELGLPFFSDSDGFEVSHTM